MQSTPVRHLLTCISCWVHAVPDAEAHELALASAKDRIRRYRHTIELTHLAPVRRLLLPMMPARTSQALLLHEHLVLLLLFLSLPRRLLLLAPAWTPPLMLMLERAQPEGVGMDSLLSRLQVLAVQGRRPFVLSILDPENTAILVEHRLL